MSFYTLTSANGDVVNTFDVDDRSTFAKLKDHVRRLAFPDTPESLLGHHGSMQRFVTTHPDGSFVVARVGLNAHPSGTCASSTNGSHRAGLASSNGAGEAHEVVLVSAREYGWTEAALLSMPERRVLCQISNATSFYGLPPESVISLKDVLACLAETPYRVPNIDLTEGKWMWADIFEVIERYFHVRAQRRSAAGDAHATCEAAPNVGNTRQMNGQLNGHAVGSLAG